MNLNSIINKTVLGFKVLLSQPTMFFTYVGDEFNQEKTEVYEGEEGRPDLISIRVYGSDDHVDLILKYNGISDPFSLAVGDKLNIPKLHISYYKLERPTVQEENAIKQQYMDTKRMTNTDVNRLEILKRKYNKEALLPPNVVPVGKKTYKFNKDAGTIIFGAQAQNGDITASNTPDYTGMTQEQALAQAQEVEQSYQQIENANGEVIQNGVVSSFQENGGKADSVGDNNFDSGNPTPPADSTSGQGTNC